MEISITRGDITITYKSWKTYAKTLEKEVRCLQQFLSTERITSCFKASIKKVK